MNRYFQDARYHLERAGKTAAKGVREELQPVERRVRELTGHETEPEPTGLEKVKADLRDLQAKAEDEAERTVGTAREKLDEYRGRDRVTA